MTKDDLEQEMFEDDSPQPLHPTGEDEAGRKVCRNWDIL